MSKRDHEPREQAKAEEKPPERPSEKPQEKPPERPVEVAAEKPPGNQAQAEYWSGLVGKRWASYQDAMDQVLRPLGDAALEPGAGRRQLRRDLVGGVGHPPQVAQAQPHPA